MAVVVEKLEKRLASLRRACETEELQLDLPLEESGFDPAPPRPEWMRRIEPRKEKARAEKYKLRLREGTEAVVKYDDYRELLRVNFEKMEIGYDYARLPAALKQHFRGLGELNAALKASNTKVSFRTNGALVFPFRARLPYDPLRCLSISLKSERSSLTVRSAREEDPPAANFFRKYQQDEEIIEEEENSSFGERLSNKSGVKSYKFGEKMRENQDNGENLPGIDEDKAENALTADPPPPPSLPTPQTVPAPTPRPPPPPPPET